ncbi:MAG: RDD family protein [Bacteroidetes bacterium]|nr:RDD family protein [Bacteroidota bacterium]
MEENESLLGDIEKEETEVTSGQRYIINLVDGIIEGIILVSVYFLLGREGRQSFYQYAFIFRYLVILLIVMGYRLVCIMITGKTIGMLLFKAKFLDKQLQPLTSPGKVQAAFNFLVRKIKLYKDQ